MLLEGMFLVIFGIIVTSVAAFANKINAAQMRTRSRRVLPMDKFDLAPAVHPLSEVVEHGETPDDPRAYDRAYGTEQMQRGAALRRSQRQTGVRAV